MTNKILVLDAGHGDTDPGSLGADIHESAATLIATNQLKQFLEARYLVDIFMTRSDNQTYPTLAERAQLAIDENADGLISIHYNHFDGTANGYEDLIQELLPSYPQAAASIALQDTIHAKVLPVLQAYGVRDRGSKPQNLQVLRDSYNQCPGILIEGLFLDNEDDAEFFYNADYQRDFIKAIGEGIAEAFSLPKLSPTTADFVIEADGLLVAQAATIDEANAKVKAFYEGGNVGKVNVEIVKPVPGATAVYTKTIDYKGKVKGDGDISRTIWFTGSYTVDAKPAQIASEVNGGYAGVATKGDASYLTYSIQGAPVGRQVQFEFDFNVFTIGDRDFLLANLDKLTFTISPKSGTKYYIKVWNPVNETYTLLHTDSTGTLGEKSVSLLKADDILKYVSTNGVVRFSAISYNKTLDSTAEVQLDFDFAKLVADYKQ